MLDTQSSCFCDIFIAMKDLSKEMKAMLEKSKLNQQEIANKIGVHFTAVYKWLDGTRVPKIDSLVAFAEACGYYTTIYYRGEESYVVFQKKTDEDPNFSKDIEVLSESLDTQRRDLLKQIAVRSPDMSDQTIEVLRRIVQDVVPVVSRPTIAAKTHA